MTTASKTGQVNYKVIPKDGAQGPQGIPGNDGRDGLDGPLIYPAGAYDSTRTYTRDNLSAPVVVEQKEHYVLLKPSSTGINPKDDVAANGGTWKHIQQFQYLFVQMLMAEYAKLASAVFLGDFMYSQHGTGTGTYDKFDPTKLGTGQCLFTPNLYIDWLRGLLVGNNIEMKDGGKIGGFELNGFNLHNVVGKDCWISIEFNNGTSSRVSSLGNNVPGLSAFETAGYFSMQGTEENCALMLKAKGSTAPLFCGRAPNYALVASGGVKWNMEANDHWDAPGVLFSATIDSRGNILNRWGDGLGKYSPKCEPPNNGVYRITHSIGHGDYHVSVTPYFHENAQRGPTMTCWLLSKGADHIEIKIASTDGTGRNTSFEVVVVGRNHV